MDTLRWNCSTNFIWVQKHLGYQISFQKMTSLFIILFRLILNSSSKNGSETTESKRVFMWDRDELRPVWVCIGLHTFLFILLHGTGLKMNWDRSDFVSVAGPDTSCVYKRNSHRREFHTRMALWFRIAFALEWFASYLADRTHRVTVNDGLAIICFSTQTRSSSRELSRACSVYGLHQ